MSNGQGTDIERTPVRSLFGEKFWTCSKLSTGQTGHQRTTNGFTGWGTDMLRTSNGHERIKRFLSVPRPFAWCDHNITNIDLVCWCVNTANTCSCIHLVETVSAGDISIFPLYIKSRNMFNLYFFIFFAAYHRILPLVSVEFFR